MARPLRLEYPGAVYHVMSRGHERSSVFRGEADRERWLQLLSTVSERERWAVHGYCLMGNHYHLLVETPDGRLSAGVHALNSRYAQWFNHRRDRHGHLFEGRFRAVLVQKDSHLLELHRYILLNPVRSGVVRSAGDWRWSNYRATAGLSERPAWLDVDWTLSQFGATPRIARAAYRRFVSEGKGAKSPLDNVEGQIYLGDEGFLRDLDRLAKTRRSDARIPPRQRRPARPSLEQVRRAVAKEWGLAIAQLSSPRRADPKIAAIYLTRKLTGMKVADVADAFEVGSARVSNVVRQIEEGQDSDLARRISRLERSLAET